ncbi:putative FMNH2-utilizing oxygenase [Actinoplanes italicus]|uniref:Alkanesulfonate monooxygenase SsuD/methylene tetrahydromethanopterin reductase-like flavin-dependent oxidoreductase (Luciferase family) n=1 Tax=Actinoplanes italicus TaxID=113567 RepID=A0A2T0K7Q0_9ACTN|nr:LLM class flavin-dependent oxidoreductase [Actinoplanes italicus]PRX19046.1 alkanesulfonate monooxygenase SsuD/methylene tetrahydromethanopterin reductase-like flavin-dependent oxidoreductase (luciferase family) [Actinoplanes italicus]GIE32376.1 putative FMNH2-utilizing oxygenase [Actinoplanes italicus]
MTLHLGVALSGDSFAADDWIRQVREADEAGLDFVTFDDTFGRHGPDAVQVAARVAPLTRHIGLIPVATTTHTEPFHLSTALATLDWVSRGRAGWQVRVSGDPAEAALLGRRAPLQVDALIAEASDAIEVVRRLWDSWEDDAIISDVATGRYIDREKLHYIDFAGEHFSVKGPSIVPRPPQGQPVVAALAHGPQVWDALDADVFFVTPADADDAARKVRTILPEKKIFADIRVGGHIPTDAATFNGTTLQLADLIQNWWSVSGLDGFRLRVSDISDVSDLVTELRRRGLFQTSRHRTLRDRLGLPVAVNRYQEAGRA